MRDQNRFRVLNGNVVIPPQDAHVNAPPAPEDAARLEARATEYVRLAGEAADPHVKRDRLRQAAQARIASGRMLEAIADAIPSPPPEWGLPLAYGAPAHARAFTRSRGKERGGRASKSRGPSHPGQRFASQARARASRPGPSHPPSAGCARPPHTRPLGGAPPRGRRTWMRLSASGSR
jgi:hypothetical protein